MLVWSGNHCGFRPLLCVVPDDADEQSAEESGPIKIASASRISDREARAVAFKGLFERLAAQASDPEWARFDRYVDSFRDVPAVALDLVRFLSGNVSAATMALIRCADAKFEYVWSLLKTLPFFWQLVPVREWTRAAQKYVQGTGSEPPEIQALLIERVIGVFKNRLPARIRGAELIGAWITQKISTGVPSDSYSEAEQVLAWVRRPAVCSLLMQSIATAEEQLLRLHADQHWPPGPAIADFHRILSPPSELRSLWRPTNEGTRFREAVLNAPIAASLASLCAVALDKTTVYQIRRLRDFDQEWFDTAYDNAMKIGMGILLEAWAGAVGVSETKTVGEFSRIARELSRRAARAVVSDLGPASEPLRSHLRELLERPGGEPGSFLGESVFEPIFDWERGAQPMKALAGNLLSRQLVAAMNRPPRELEPYRFAEDWHPYRHQLAAWETLSHTPPLSVGITSGTGSGKTECFLVPILDQLVREMLASGDNLVGVRALLLYPLNALINSQRDRLRAWTAGFGGKIRFCLYNGDTPETVPAHHRASSMEQVLARRELRDDPPPILVTNGTMLEYMLVRAEDQPILRAIGRQTAMDRAGRGSYLHRLASCRVALLLRRVMHAFRVRGEDVHFVATSATISDQNDRTALVSLQQFITDIAGIPRERVRVIDGKRAVPALPETIRPVSREPLNTARLRQIPEEEQFKALLSNEECVRIRIRLGETPAGALTLTDLTQELTRKDQRLQSREDRYRTLELLDLCSTTRGPNGEHFLPLRAHFFLRTQSGVWTCWNKQCPGRSDTSLNTPGWQFGKLFLKRRERCDACGSLTYPLAICLECGEEYLLATETLENGNTFLSAPGSTLEDDEFEPEIESEEENESGGSNANTGDIGRPRLIPAHPDHPALLLRFDLGTGQMLGGSAAGAEIPLAGP